MDAFRAWWDEAGIDATERLAKEAFEAGRAEGFREGMRHAAEICQSHKPKDYTVAAIITRASCADAILSEVK